MKILIECKNGRLLPYQRYSDIPLQASEGTRLTTDKNPVPVMECIYAEAQPRSNYNLTREIIIGVQMCALENLK